jgi:hypothetical protein
MRVYEQRATVTTASGSYSQTTLENVGGLLRYLLIRPNTSALTNFQATITDYKGVIRKRYGFHTGELIDDTLTIPVSGAYTVEIVNGSPDDTFTIIFGVQES